jgi:hypothetical protein
MKKVWLIIGASLRSQLRWAKQHVYAWLILAPLILSITYMTASRLAENLSTDDFSFTQISMIGTALFLCLMGLSLSRASAEIYHLRRPTAYFETLPVDVNTYIHAALLTRLGRTIVTGLVILAIKVILKESIYVTTVLTMLSFVMILAVTEIFAALQWIHWSYTKDKAMATFSILIIGLTAYNRGGGLLAITFKPEDVWQGRLMGDVLLTMLWAALLYEQTRKRHRSWRASDVEHARRIEAAKSFNLFSASVFRRRFSPGVASQIARDFQLTLRGFSSAVYVIALLVPLLLAALVAALTTNLLPPIPNDLGWFDTMQLPQISAVKITCSLIAASLAALTPVLVAYELPHLWLERVTGTSGLDMWQAKIAYARLMSLPAPLLAFLLGIIFGRLPMFYIAPLFLECLMLWWAVSSLIGALSFEMPTRPGLALIVMITVGIGAGLAASFGLFTSAFLPLGLMVYAQAMHGLTDRGRARARYYLLYGDD